MSTYHRPTPRTVTSCPVDGSKLARWILTAAIVITSPLSAQTDSVATWPIGSRVRAWTPFDRKFVGYLREVRGDTLIFVAPGASRVQKRVLVDSIARLEVSAGRVLSAYNVARGGLIGAGLSVGAVALLNARGSCTVDGGCWDPPYGGIALVGAAVGAVAGVFVLKEHWRPVRIPGRVSFMQSPRGSAITVSFAFR
jgi:hypothetical protein